MVNTNSGSGNASDDVPHPLQIMPKALVKSYASGTASTDAVIGEIVPVTGRLSAIQVCIRATVAAAATENVMFELSLQSTSQFTATSASGVIAYCGTGTPTSTGGNINFATYNLSGFDLPVQAGTKLYVHRSTTGAFSAVTIDVIWCIN